MRAKMAAIMACRALDSIPHAPEGAGLRGVAHWSVREGGWINIPQQYI